MITSPANPRLKALVGLRRRRAREEQEQTLLEGQEELALALSVGVRPQALYYCPELMGAGDPALGRPSPEALIAAVATTGAQVVQVSRAAFHKVSYREGPDGVLAVVATPAAGCADLNLVANPLLLVGEGIEKPGNLGAILRTADAAGVDAVIAADPVTDWGNPNTVRSSKGTVFSVPVASDPSTVVVDFLREHGIPLVAATPDTSVEYTEVDYTGPVAIAVGAEQTGLSQQLLAAATHRVRIPMSGAVNSLNVATSAAIIAYEAVRQRGA